MEFEKYQKVKRLGSQETYGLMDGVCYVFPKIDGTNANVWLKDGAVSAGSRNRELGFGEDDNQGFNRWVKEQSWIYDFLISHPNLRIYGEWLVPHTLKDYEDSAWRNFYVFDVVDVGRSRGEDYVHHMHYNEYAPMLKLAGFNVIDPIFFGTVAPTILNDLLKKNTYLMKEGCVGEGLVIKNYDYVNKYGRVCWGKVIHEEFTANHKSKPAKVADVPVEYEIVQKTLTKPMCDKVLAKIKNESDGFFESYQIPRLLNTIYYDFVTEEIWNVIKKFKNPTINFKALQAAVMAEAKKHLPEVF